MKRRILLLATFSVFTVFWSGCGDLSKPNENQTPPPAQGGSEPNPGGGAQASTADPDADADIASIAAWNALKAEAFPSLRTSSEWGTPELLGAPINTRGWEDSIHISGDGSTLYWAYFPGDLLGWAVSGKADPTKFAQHKKGPGRHITPECSIDIFSYDLRLGATGSPSKFDLSRDLVAEGGLMRGSEGHWYYQSNAPGTAAEHDDNIYRDGEKLPAPVNTKYDELDPHYINGDLLFWSEHRPGAKGGKDIWITHENAPGQWTNPVPLAEPVNSKANEWTMFLTADGKLYFTSDREGGKVAIWMSDRLGPNSWSKPKKVLWPKDGSKLIGVAEPTLTDDGKWLYFVVIFRNDAGVFDADIGRVSRK